MSPVRNQRWSSKAIRRRRRCVFPVARKDAGAADEEFAVFGDAAFDVGQRLADRAHAIGVGRVDGEDGRGFREAVAFEDADAGAGEPVRGVEAEGRAAGDEVADAAAEAGAEFGVDELVGELSRRARGAVGRRRRRRDVCAPVPRAQAKRRRLTADSERSARRPGGLFHRRAGRRRGWWAGWRRGSAAACRTQDSRRR